MLMLTAERTRTPGPAVLLNCRFCHSEQATAHTEQIIEVAKLSYVIPLGTSTFTEVTCDICERTRRLMRPLDDVQALDIETLSIEHANATPIIIRVLCGIAIATVILPLVGPVLAVLAMHFSRGERTGWRTLAITAFYFAMLQVLIFAAFFVAALMSS